MRRSARLLMLLSLPLGVLVFVWLVRRPDSRMLEPSARYVGDKVCAECHVQIAASYARSGMSHSWQDVDARKWDFGIDLRVSDSRQEYLYQPMIKDGRLCQEETRPDEAGHRLVKPAHYAIGSGRHARALANETNGYLTLLPLAWFSATDSWRLNPGYELRNERFNRPIVAACMACHGGQGELVGPDRHCYRSPITGGTSCERCHGPGGEHVRLRRQPALRSEDVSHDSIINPAHLTAARANDLCLQCHLQADVTVFGAGRSPLEFQPGDTLTHQRADYFLRTDDSASLGIASHGARFLASRCAKEGRLTCIHCHDPHRPVEDFSREHFDTRCLTCHTQQSCHRPLDVASTTFSCTQCHMPQRSTREAQHLAFTDHWIRAKPDDHSTLAAAPQLPAADAQLQGCFPGLDSPARLGAAYVLLHETMGPRQPALLRGLGLLQAALRTDPHDRQSIFWLASALIALHRGDEAVAPLERLLASEPQWHEARFRLAVAYDQQRKYAQAIGHYEQLIAQAPRWLEPYPLLIRLHLFQGAATRAEELCRQHLEQFPNPDAYASLALARQLQQAPATEVLSWIDRALALDPRHVPAHLNRGYLRLTLGDKDAARRDFELILSTDPEHQKARAGLTAAQ